jgi:hypothetical protein
LLQTLHPSGYCCHKPGDKPWIRKRPDCVYIYICTWTFDTVRLIRSICKSYFIKKKISPRFLGNPHFQLNTVKPLISAVWNFLGFGLKRRKKDELSEKYIILITFKCTWVFLGNLGVVFPVKYYWKTYLNNNLGLSRFEDFMINAMIHTWRLNLLDFYRQNWSSFAYFMRTLLRMTWIKRTVSNVHVHI